MQDRVNPDIGAPEPDGFDWNAIDWAAVNHKVKNLRQRIYRATQEGKNTFLRREHEPYDG